MSFWEPTEKKEQAFDKPNFMRLSEDGTYTIRILDEAMKYRQHWLGSPFRCLGDECPQCELNRQILLDNNGNFDAAKKVGGFNWPQERGAVNVLDRTLVKVCPATECQNENVADESGIFPANCSKCGAMLTQVKELPSNKVKLFSRAGSVFDKMFLLHKSIQDGEGNPIGIFNFDVDLMVSGNTTIPRASKPLNTEELKVPEDALWDKNRIVIDLTAEEIKQRMRGVSLRDIFAARSASQDVPDDENKPQLSEEEKQKLAEEIDQMFA